MTNNLSLNSAQYIDEAVDLLRRRDQRRADVQVGIEQADRRELIPAEEVFARLEARAKSNEQTS